MIDYPDLLRRVMVCGLADDAFSDEERSEINRLVSLDGPEQPDLTVPQTTNLNDPAWTAFCRSLAARWERAIPTGTTDAMLLEAACLVLARVVARHTSIDIDRRLDAVRTRVSEFIDEIGDGTPTIN